MFKLNIYEDETLTTIKKTVEADKLRVPYRVATTIISGLDEINIEHIKADEVINYLNRNLDKLDAIIKATFKISDSDLDNVDGGELLQVGKEIFNWGINQINSIDSKNEQAPTE